MSKHPPPFSEYHRRALAWLATDIARARAERLAADVIHKAKCPCPPALDQRNGGAPIDTRAGCAGPCNQGRRPERCPSDCGHHMAQHAEAPAPHSHRDRGIEGPVHIPLHRRLAARWKRLVESLVDPVVRT